jgi:hypothetical protein
LHHLATDKRYYVGVRTDSGDAIRVFGFCHDLVEPQERCPPSIDDGGDCIWWIRFQSATGTFEDFGTNGEG